MGRLTRKQLSAIVSEYASRLGWRVRGGTTLVRITAPLAQGITFDSLSYGGYRSFFWVSNLLLPTLAPFGEYSQQILRPNGTDWIVTDHAAEHDAYWNAIVLQVVPCISDNLTVGAYAGVLNSLLRHNLNTTFSLALLEEYRGHRDRATSLAADFEVSLRSVPINSELKGLFELRLAELKHCWADSGPQDRLRQLGEEEAARWLKDSTPIRAR